MESIEVGLQQMTEEEIEYEIAVSVKDQKYLIKVPKNSDISEVVHSFLVTNGLNLKHKKAILNMVRQKLKHEQKTQDQQNNKIPVQTKKENPQPAVIEQKQHQELSPENKPMNQTVNNNIKMGIISKIKQQLESYNQEQQNQQPPDCRKVYEQWKKKQKQKTQKQSKIQLPCQNSQLKNNNKTVHSPDYFYKKGLKFKQNCQQNCENQFKKLYPFKLNHIEIKQKEQIQLCERLSKQKKEINVRNYLSQKSSDQNSKVLLKEDQIKRKVKKMDDEVDRALFEMIKKGELPSPRFRSQSRSPFRKTVFR